MENRITSGPGGVTFQGRNAVEVYRLTILASALKLYGLHKLQVNRAYTPGRMLRAAGHALDCTFKRGAYLQAAEALYARVDALKDAVAVETAAGVQ